MKPSELSQNPFYDPQNNALTRARRPRNALSDERIRELLAQIPTAHIATRWDEQPFVIPTNFWYDVQTHRIVFHSNAVGRLRANSERHPKVCLEVSEMGRFLPSNDPLEVSVQYRSAVVFGTLRLLEGEEARQALYGLVQRYFPQMQPGREYRPITEADLERTSTYELTISEWSGKENWEEKAIQSEEWPALEEHWFQ